MDTIDDPLAPWLAAHLDEAARVQQAVRQMTPLLVEVARRIAGVLEGGHKLLFFGNGGSAADAQHWAAELSGRFYFDRPSLPALALSTNTSQLTAIGNDYGYDEVFARPLRGLSRPGDLAVGISTSGRSRNVIAALEAARKLGIGTLGFAGGDGGDMRACCDQLVVIPSRDTARIQEGHELCAHLILAAAEHLLFGERSAEETPAP